MTEFLTNKDRGEKITFRELVLEHLRRIMKISSREFTKTDYIKNYGNYVEHIKGTDNGLNYIQSVEAFASLLYPYFDKSMKEKYETLMKYIDCWSWEFGNTFGKELIAKCKKAKGSFDAKEKIVLLRWKKIKSAKLLFLELNKLLKRIDYLKQTIYTEDEVTDIIDIDEKEEKDKEKEEEEKEE